MRVLIDTNVMISGTFWPGKSKALLNAVRRGEITCVTSEPLLEEFREILMDPQKPFRLSALDASQIVNTWRSLATVIVPISHVAVCRDPDDNCVLECALEGHAEYIITGDKDLLDLENFKVLGSSVYRTFSKYISISKQVVQTVKPSRLLKRHAAPVRRWPGGGEDC
jgi:putative PIN family toxin of toxin-antitoxin system